VAFCRFPDQLFSPIVIQVQGGPVAPGKRELARQEDSRTRLGCTHFEYVRRLCIDEHAPPVGAGCRGDLSLARGRRDQYAQQSYRPRKNDTYTGASLGPNQPGGRHRSKLLERASIPRNRNLGGSGSDRSPVKKLRVEHPQGLSAPRLLTPAWSK